MKVSDVMTRRVISVTPEASIDEAIRLMTANQISGLPVIDRDGNLVGMVSEGDFLRRAELGTERHRSVWFDAIFGPAQSATEFVHSHGRKVEEVMTRNPAFVLEDSSLAEVVHLMETRRIKRLPVLRRARVVGILSRANLLRAVLGLHRAAPANSMDNTSVRERILSDIDEQSWSAGAEVDVTVHDGVAHLWGRVSDPKQRDALKVLVETTPGVTRVEDHLAWAREAIPDRSDRSPL
jgi:CBS domain-containing protein